MGRCFCWSDIFVFCFYSRCYLASCWHGVMVITIAQIHSAKLRIRFCAGYNPARGMSEICIGKNLWPLSRLEIRLNAPLWLTITQKAIKFNFPSGAYRGVTENVIIQARNSAKENMKITIRSNQFLLHGSCVGFNALISFCSFRFHKGL